MSEGNLSRKTEGGPGDLERRITPPRESDMIEWENPLTEELVNPVEGTPKEWREQLRENVKELNAFSPEARQEELKVGPEMIRKDVAEAVGWYQTELAKRNSELNAQGEKIGGIEKWFRRRGEDYNKLSFKGKLAVGATLGLGAFAFSTVSVPAALTFTGLLGLQRLAGMMSMYLKFEKRALEKKAPSDEKQEEKFWKWGPREQAMAKALLYTVGMGAAIREGIEIASESSWGEATHEWLRHYYHFGHAENPPALRAMEPQPLAMPEAPAPIEEVSATLELEAQMPSVAAVHGHGYEYMAKRLWEQLQEKHIDPSKYPEGSDIQQLLKADATSIDKIIHQIASNPDHGFFQNGASVRIDLDAHMMIDADGQIHMSDSINGVKAPEDAPVTHAPQSPEVSAHAEPTATEHIPDAPAETPPAHELEVVPGTDTSNHFEKPPNADIQPPTPEAPSAVHEIIHNRFGLDIPTGEAHIYGALRHSFVSGGSHTDRMQAVYRYLSEHPRDTVYELSSDTAKTKDMYRIPWHLVNGRPVGESPMLVTPTPNRFFKFFASWMGVRGPEDFRTLIK